MTNYTLKQAHWDAIFDDGTSGDIRRILRSLKPNSQEPVGFLSKNGHLYETLCAAGDGSEPLYTHPAPISKEDMVKVLGALQQAGIPAHLDVSAKGKANYSVLREAITIMQSAIEGMK